jgi:hypothetical protein
MRVSQTKMGAPAGSLLPFLVKNLRSSESAKGRTLAIYCKKITYGKWMVGPEWQPTCNVK